MKNNLPPAPSTPAQMPVKKPFYKRTWFIVLAAVIVLAGIGNALGGDKSTDAPSSVAAPAKEVAQPQSEAVADAKQSEVAPKEEVPKEEAPVEVELSDEQVRAEFQSFVDERADSGVMIAKTITSVTFSEGIVSVVFDPESIGMDREMFDYINAFPNLAKFIGTPMAFKDEQGNRLRTRVERIDTFDTAGNSLGSASKAEIYEMGTGEKLQ